MGVNSLPKTVIPQRCGGDLDPGPTAPESGTLTTRLPSCRRQKSSTLKQKHPEVVELCLAAAAEAVSVEVRRQRVQPARRHQLLRQLRSLLVFQQQVPHDVPPSVLSAPPPTRSTLLPLSGRK